MPTTRAMHMNAHKGYQTGPMVHSVIPKRDLIFVSFRVSDLVWGLTATNDSGRNATAR